MGRIKSKILQNGCFVLTYTFVQIYTEHHLFTRNCPTTGVELANGLSLPSPIHYTTPLLPQWWTVIFIQIYSQHKKPSSRRDSNPRPRERCVISTARTDPLDHGSWWSADLNCNYEPFTPTRQPLVIQEATNLLTSLFTKYFVMFFVRLWRTLAWKGLTKFLQDGLKMPASCRVKKM